MPLPTGLHLVWFLFKPFAGSNAGSLPPATVSCCHCVSCWGPPRGPQHQSAPKQQQQQQQQVLGVSQSDTVTIKGSSKQAVSSARVRTQLLIDSVVSSRMLDYTHFVSVPLANQQTAAKLKEFQQQVGWQAGTAVRRCWLPHAVPHAGLCAPC